MKRATPTMMREEFWWGQMRRGPTGFLLGRPKAGEIRRWARSEQRDGPLAAGGPSRLYSEESKDLRGFGLRPPSRDLALLTGLSSPGTSTGTLGRVNLAWSVAIHVREGASRR
jgi:hypothetical protein